MTKQQAARLAAIDRVLNDIFESAVEANMTSIPGDGNSMSFDDELAQVRSAARTLSIAWCIDYAPLADFMCARHHTFSDELAQ